MMNKSPAAHLRGSVMIQKRAGHVPEPDRARGGLVDDGYGNMIAAPDDGYGNIVSEWQDIRDKPFAAGIVPMSRGDEDDVSGANTDSQKWTITVRWNDLTKNISTAYRVVNCRSGETYNILGAVDKTQMRRLITMTCESGKADG